MEKKVRKTDLIIVGAGPAGYTAAIYAARAGRSPLLIRGTQPGGQLMLTTEVENYPGFSVAPQGPALMDEMAKQAEKFGTRFEEDTLEAVDFSRRPFRLFGIKNDYEALCVILATGAQARWLNIPGEDLFRGHGVSSCATCDGFFFKNKKVAVVGGGNTAVEDALFLAALAKEVVVIHRRNQLRAEKILQERLLKKSNVSFMWDTVVEEVLGQTVALKKVTGLRLNTKGTTHPLEVDGFFVAIGHAPATAFLKGALALDSQGYIAGGRNDVSTSIPGVFAAGDVKDAVYRQAITAAGQGCMAALEAERFLTIHGS